MLIELGSSVNDRPELDSATVANKVAIVESRLELRNDVEEEAFWTFEYVNLRF